VGMVSEGMRLPANKHPDPSKFGRECPVFKASVLGKGVAILTTDRERKEVFSGSREKEFTKRGGYNEFLSRSFGQSSLTVDNAQYIKLVWDIFEPILSSGGVESHFSTMVRVVERNMSKWECENGGVLVYEKLKHLYSEMVSEVFLGKKPKGVDEKQFMKDCVSVFTGATSLPVSGGGFFSSSFDKGKEAGTRLIKVYKTQLLSHMAEIKRDSSTSSTSREKPLVWYVAQRVLEVTKNKDPMPDTKGPHKSTLDAAASHLMLFSTGLTTKLLASLSISFLRVLRFSRHMSWLNMIREEFATVEKDFKEGEIPSYSQVKQLDVLERLCLEIQRVFPPVAGQSRGTEHKKSHIAGYKIPKGWMIWSCSYYTNRDKSVFKKPEKFDPDRWAKTIEGEKKSGTKLPPQHLAFGFGKNKCPGMELALAMWKSFCYVAGRKYTWKLGDQEEESSLAYSTSPIDGEDGWRVKWIPVYRPSPDIKITIAKI